MVGEDQAEVNAQRAREPRRFRNVERICEARVEEDGRRAASRVLEVGSYAVEGIRRVGLLRAPFSLRARAGRGELSNRDQAPCAFAA